MNPIASKDQREELRSQHRLVNLYIPSEVKANLGLALDGLDIAEEMAVALDWLAGGFPDDDDAVKAYEVLRRWQAWRDG